MMSKLDDIHNKHVEQYTCLTQGQLNKKAKRRQKNQTTKFKNAFRDKQKTHKKPRIKSLQMIRLTYWRKG